MELQKEQLRVTETKFRDKTVAYAEGDIIVPDVKPDILKILQVDAVSVITSKEVSGGVIKVSGIVKYNILYIPDHDGESVKGISAEMNFSHAIDKKNITEDAITDVSTDIERIEFSLLNSRKLNIKAAVTIGYTVWETEELSLATGIDFENAEVIYESLKTESLKVMDECSFIVRDKFEIPRGRASISEILRLDINISDKEIKAITGKAVIRGNVSVCALYIDTNGEINCIDGEIPFTEVAEIFELEEDAECSVKYRLGDFSYECGMDGDGEPRTVDFDISVNALISSSEKKEIEIMKDCFCPGCHTDMVYDSAEIESVLLSDSNQYTVKELISPDKKIPQIASVYNVVTKPIITKAQAVNGRISVEGKLETYILYITDNSQIPVYSFKKDIPVEFSIENEEATEDLNCTVDATVLRTTYNLNMANEVELRCNISLETRLTRRKMVEVISDCTLCEGEKNSGIVVYFVQPGDTLWEIAKRYLVSVNDIVKLNDLQDKNKLTVGERLIIPFN